MGSGIPMEIGEIGFKCNFAYMDENTKIVTKRRADSILKLIRAFCWMGSWTYKEFKW